MDRATGSDFELDLPVGVLVTVQCEDIESGSMEYCLLVKLAKIFWYRLCLQGTTPNSDIVFGQ